MKPRKSISVNKKSQETEEDELGRQTSEELFNLKVLYGNPRQSSISALKSIVKANLIPEVSESSSNWYWLI